MFKKGRYLLSLLLIAALVGAAGLCYADTAALQSSALGYFENSVSSISSFWELGALKGADVAIENENRTIDESLTAPLESSLPTDYADKIIALLIAGKDPRTAAGRDIVAELAKKQKSSGAFSNDAVNQHVWAMIALDAAKQSYKSDKALQYLSGLQKDDGGYNLSKEELVSDVDVTAMTLIALSNHKGNTIADGLITAAVEFLKTAQLENAGFASKGGENSNSISTAISGLVSVGEDVSSGDWVKGETTMIDALAKFALPDGSYTYSLENPESNQMATVQALIAYNEIIKGKSTWTGFDVPLTVTANVRIEGISANILHKDVTVSKVGPKVVDAIEKALTENNIDFNIPVGTYGKEIVSINGEAKGAFGGYDGWLYVVNDTPPVSGIDSLDIKNGDRIVVYYGDYSSTLYPTYTVSPSTIRAGDKIRITLTSTYFDWVQNKDVTVNIEDASVKIGNKTYKTNSEGVATIDDIDEKGTYKVIISKEQQDSYPAMVRIPEFEINVLRKETGGGGGPSIKPQSMPQQTEQKPEETEQEPSVPAAAVKKEYSDRAKMSDWAVEKIEKAKEHGFMKGTTEDTFEPEKAITRGEFVALLVRLLKTENAEAIDYSDVKESDWFYKYVAIAKKLGLVSGFEDNTFRPNDTITREQMAVIISRAFSIDDGSITFDDENEISDWSKSAAKKLAVSGIMTGSDGRFAPKDSVTREMAAVVAVRLYEKYLK